MYRKSVQFFIKKTCQFSPYIFIVLSYKENIFFKEIPSEEAQIIICSKKSPKENNNKKIENSRRKENYFFYTNRVILRFVNCFYNFSDFFHDFSFFRKKSLKRDPDFLKKKNSLLETDFFHRKLASLMSYPIFLYIKIDLLRFRLTFQKGKVALRNSNLFYRKQASWGNYLFMKKSPSEEFFSTYKFCM